MTAAPQALCWTATRTWSSIPGGVQGGPQRATSRVRERSGIWGNLSGGKTGEWEQVLALTDCEDSEESITPFVSSRNTNNTSSGITQDQLLLHSVKVWAVKGLTGETEGVLESSRPTPDQCVIGPADWFLWFQWVRRADLQDRKLLLQHDPPVPALTSSGYLHRCRWCYRCKYWTGC